MMNKMMRRLSMILAIAMMVSCFGGVGFAETEMIVAPMSLTAFKLYSGDAIASDIPLKAGETVQLTAKPDSGAVLGDITWSSNNPSVATVKNGMVTAVSAGDARITATSEGETQTCMIQVLSPITYLQLKPDWVEMKVGQSMQINAEADADLSAIRWFSDDEKVVTVTNGRVTAVGPGKTTVQAQCDGVMASCEITVVAAELVSIQLTVVSDVLKVGDTTQLTAVPNAGAELGEMEWSSSDASIATVNDGKVTAVAPGKVTIQVECDGVVAACELTVAAEMLRSIELTPATAAMLVGEDIQLTATPNAGAELGEIAWSSTNTAVAAVENGKVTAVAPGTASIKASCGSIEAVCSVTVSAPLNALEMNLREMKLEAGRSADLTVSANEGAVLGDVQWTSSDETVATVKNGKVTAVGAGTALITAAAGGRAASCTVTVTAPLTGISLNVQTADLLTGETRQLEVIANEGAVAENVTWTSSNTAVVSVKDGLVTALSVGEATITAVCGNYHATCKVAVSEPLTQITLSQSELLLEEGKEIDLTATPNAGASLKGAAWSTSDDTVATVDNGKVKAVSSGTAVITIACGDVIASCTVTVQEYVPPVEILDSDGILYVGETLQLNYRYNYDAQEALRSAVWSVDKTSVATIDADSGLMTGVSMDTVKATITCTTTAWRTYKAEVEVQVGLRVTGIVLDKTELAMELGDEQTLQAALTPEGAVGEMIWSSSNTAVAAVDEDGKVKAVGPGSATITVSCEEFTATCSVKVQVSAKGISVYNPEMTLYPKQKGNIRFELQPANTTDKTIQWVSSDETIATVTASGIVRGVSEGECTITGTAASGVTTTVKVTIVPKGQAVTALKLSKSSLTLSRTQSVTLTAKTTPSKAVDKSVTWVAQDPSIATVDENGVVTGIAPGKTTIMAVSTSGVYKNCKVTVKPLAVSKVTLSQTTATMKSGDTLQLSCSLLPADADDLRVRWTSSKSSVASVDPQTGLVTAKKNGTVTITCKAASGKTARCKITVKAITPVMDTSKLTLTKGESYTVGLTFNPYTEDDIPVKWTTSKASVATVNAQGVITAMSPGTATIAVTAISGKKDTLKVTVKPVLVSDIELSNSYGDFAVGGRYKLDVSCSPADATKQAVTWKSSNSKIAKINATTGEFICKKPGQVTITATTTDGSKLKAYYEINVVKLDVTEFYLNTEAIKIKTGETYETVMTLMGETYGIQPVWSSDNEYVATVDQNGVITAVGSGITMVRCTLGGMVCSVKVTVPANSSANYRVLVAGEYTNSKKSGYLNFAANGLAGVSSAFDLANIYGDRYEMLQLNNPKKGTLLGNIEAFFAEADKDDISVLYLLSHGTIVNGQYRWLIEGSREYITEADLTGVLEHIEGKVVLVMVSCRSGQYLEEYVTSGAVASLKGVLTTMNGSRPGSEHINVITSNTNELRGAYTDATKDQSFDFFSRVFNEALGWDQLNQKPYEKVFSDTNGDGKVTLEELVNYIDSHYQKSVYDYVDKYGEDSIEKNKDQQIEYYLTDPDLVIYARTTTVITEK